MINAQVSSRCLSGSTVCNASVAKVLKRDFKYRWKKVPPRNFKVTKASFKTGQRAYARVLAFLMSLPFYFVYVDEYSISGRPCGDYKWVVLLFSLDKLPLGPAVPTSSADGMTASPSQRPTPIACENSSVF